MKALPWFRMYHEALDDEKLGLLAFEDRWHFIAILCLKCRGVLDGGDDIELLTRKVALKMGLTCAELEKVAKRLARMGLIDSESFQPVAWEGRQMQSDSGADRTKKYRERMKRHSDVTVTVQEEDTDTDTDTEQKKKATGVATPDGVSDAVWQDFKKLRVAKKAPITTTALDGIRREAGKAGLSLPDALALCCERGWAGFKAEWVQSKPEFATTVPAKPGIDPALAKVMADKLVTGPPSADILEKIRKLTTKVNHDTQPST